MKTCSEKKSLQHAALLLLLALVSSVLWPSPSSLFVLGVVATVTVLIGADYFRHSQNTSL